MTQELSNHAARRGRDLVVLSRALCALALALWLPSVAAAAETSSDVVPQPAAPTAAAVTTPVAAPDAGAGNSASVANADHEMWLVSSRRLPNPCGPCVASAEFDFWQWADGCWRPATAAAFWSGSLVDRVTCIHVHGNRMTLQDARVGGVDLFRQLQACSGTRFRLVVWTWPSDRIHGMARDVFTKMDRADGESYYLASFLAKMPSGGRVSLMGYSFGARSVVGGLHLLGGGSVRGTSLAAEAPETLRPRVVLLAAALPMGSLVPNGSRGLALPQAASVASFYNAADPALKAFERFGEKSDLLGRHHVAEGCLGEAGAQVLQYNATKTVGKSHDINDYLQSPPLMQAIREHLLHANQF